MASDRRAMTVRLVGLRSAEAAEPPTGASTTERLRVVREMSELAWRLSGRPLPEDSRRNLQALLRPLRSASEPR